MTDSDQLSVDDLLAALIAERLAGGEPDLEALLAAHPDKADEIRVRYADLEQLSMLWREGPQAAFSGGLAAGASIGEYEIEREIGRGGMGVVYLALQKDLGRQVALKVIPPATLSAITRQRFLREAKALASLSHPNIVPVFTAGEQAGSLFIAMEYVPGAPLSTLISAVRRRPVGQKASQAWEECLGPGERTADATPAEGPESRTDETASLDDRYVHACVAVTMQIAEALADAHNTGVVHRDVKPGNIIVSPEGRARLLDFGLAAIHTEPHVTVSGEFFGTPHYVAPEQATGQGDRVGPASDLYSLGATLYECLTLRPPFDAESIPEVLSRLLNEEPIPARKLNPTLSKDLETILAKALSKNPIDRYESMGDFADDLQRFLDGRPIRARRITWSHRAAKWARRRPVVTSLLVLLLTVIIAAAGIWSWQWRRTREVVAGSRKAIRAAEDAEAARISEAANAERWRYVRLMADADEQWRAGDVAAVQVLLEEAPTAWRNWEWHLLQWRCHAEQKSLPRGSGALHLNWRPDGQGLVVSSNLGDVQMWDIKSGNLARTIMPYPGYSGGVAYLEDGQQVVSACADGTVRVWDAATGGLLRSFPGAPNPTGSTSRPITDMAVAPDERHLLTVGGELNVSGWARLHELDTGRLLKSLTGHQSTIDAVAFAPDGGHFATTARDGTAHIWDVTQDEAVLSLRGHGDGYRFVYDVAYSPNGKLMATCGEGGLVKCWNPLSGALVRTLQFGQADVRGMAFSPDSELLATTHADGAAVLWNVDSGEVVTVFRGHLPLALSVAFSHDGQRLATGGQRSVKIWDVATRQEGIPFGQPIASLVVTCDGANLVATSAEPGGLGIWSVDGLRLLRHGGSASDRVVDIATHPTVASRLAVLDRESGISIWDIAVGERKLTIEPDAGEQGAAALSFSPEGRSLAVGYSRVWRASHRPPAAVQIHDVATGAVTKELRFPDCQQIVDVAFSPNGRYVAAVAPYLDAQSGQTPGGVAIWSWPDGRYLRTFRQSDGGALYSLALSSDGRYVAAGSNEGVIRVWEVDSAEELTEMRGHGSRVNAMAFSPDASRLVSVGHEVMLWDLLTGQSVLTLWDDGNGYDRRFEAVAFIPDGTAIVAGGRNRPMRIWRLPPTPESSPHSVKDKP
ncbi:MAG: protein kinase [Planctomycetes bacterium]|nr:protein kinase [Planctomycetota bacterium]